jgi:23S rRNA pseudouridine1911/1915/1917 synthase
MSREKMAIRAISDGAREAVTFYEVAERFRGFALVRCKPQSGRTHQIRVHLTHIGHPIVADKLYSGRDRVLIAELIGAEASRAGEAREEVTLIDRQALHAHRLRFRHPITKRELDLTAPCPDDISRTLEALRLHRSR